MDRRQFLKSSISSVAIASLPRILRGETFGVATAKVSQKGVGCNDLSSNTLLNNLNLKWFYTDWGSYCWTPIPGLNPDIKYMFNFYYTIPNPADIERAVLNQPNFPGWWMIGGNEPELEGYSDQQIIDLAIAQMEAVLSVVDKPKFCLTLGSQYHAPNNLWGNRVWIKKIWAGIPPILKKTVRAFHTHYYAQADLGENDPTIFQAKHIKRYLDSWNTYLASHMQDAGAQNLWLSEVGLAKSTLTANSPNTALYPQTIAKACQGRAQFWAWYGFKDIPLYENLWANSVDLTEVGKTFSNTK